MGLTPFLSLLRSGRLDQPTTMIYLYRAEADALFLDELRAIAGRLPQLTLRLTATGDEMPNPASMLDDADEVTKGEFWLCGPPPMIEIFTRYLHRRGIANRRLHFENFGSL